MTSHVLFTPVKCNNGGKRTLVSAISHTSCHEPAKTSNEKRKDPFANVGTPPKKGKVEPTFTLAPCIDGRWNCVFVDEEIIPLWPQYVHKDNIERHYIRIDKCERWVTDYMVVLKRSKLRDAGVVKDNFLVKNMANSVCHELLAEFSKAVAAARKKHKEPPLLFPITMHDCKVQAAPYDRQCYILSGSSALEWIQKGLRRIVTDYLGVQLEAIRHTTAIHHDPSFTHRKADVRDKVTWSPCCRRWLLKFKGAAGADADDCKKNEISLAVPGKYEGKPFEIALEYAFYDACDVWNAIDTSGKTRINMPERQLDEQMPEVLEIKEAGINVRA